MKFDANSGILFTQDEEATAWSGIATKSIDTTYSLTQGKVYYLTTNGQWDQADANQDEDHASHMLGIGIGTGTVAARGVGLQGFITIEGHGFVVGAPLYLSNTPGAMTTTVPTSGWARICGYAVTEDSIYFDPDKTYITIP